MEDTQTQTTTQPTFSDTDDSVKDETVTPVVNESEDESEDSTETTAASDEDATENTDDEDTQSVSANGALSILQIESIIKRHLLDIQKLQERYKEKKSMFDDSFNNDANYKTLADKAKEATRLKTAAKQQLMKSPSIMQLAQEVKDMKEEMVDLEQTVSDYLQEYQRVSGSNQLETDDGQILEIVHVTKVVRKSKYRP